MAKRTVNLGRKGLRCDVQLNRSELRTLKQQGVVGSVKKRLDETFVTGLQAAMHELYSHPEVSVYIYRQPLVARLDSDPADHAEFLSLIKNQLGEDE